MIQYKKLTASTPLYRCWKKSVNETALDLVSKGVAITAELIYQEIEKKYKCKTVYVQRRDPDRNIIRSVDLEFPNENHVSCFLLRWS